MKKRYQQVNVQLFATPWTTACQASLPLIIFQNFPKFMSIESVMPSNRRVLCLWPSIFPNLRVFSNKSAFHIMWPKDCSCSCSLSPSNECSGLISCDLLAVQGTKSLLQHHNWKASVLQCSAFFMVQLSQISPALKTEHRPQFFFFLAALCHMWALSALPRDGTFDPCNESVES